MSSTTGHVDRFEGQYVTGWAIDLPYVRPCSIRLVAPDGSELGQGKANLPRDDLTALGHGRNNFAFRVPFPELDRDVAIHVLANGTELPGSPIEFRRGIFEGWVQIVDGFVDGWVVERGAKASAPLVDLYDAGGAPLGSFQSRLDVDANPLFSPARFGGPLPDACFGHEELEIEARVGGSAFARAHTKARLKGYLDVLTPERCAGWLYSPDHADRRFAVAVFRDGEEVGQGDCRLHRDDLSGHVPAGVDVGFDIEFLTPHRTDIEVCELSLRIKDSEMELFGGPFLAGRRPALFSSLHGAARQALGLPLGRMERTILRSALAQFAKQVRAAPDYMHLPVPRKRAVSAVRMGIIIPVYRGVEVTRTCIESVLRCRDEQRMRVILINDASPDPDMAGMLAKFEVEANLTLVANETNLGFVRTVNRGLALLPEGDALLLNSDTVMFRGALEELASVLHSAPDIGTATALSNNATIFSYPHPTLASAELADVVWEELAAVAVRSNHAHSIGVPTAHGFCMLIRRELLDLLGPLDEAFGRGYGEENEFCLRALDVGYRHVAATGAFVQHVENVSFGKERSVLLHANLRLLQERFPEFAATVVEFERADPLRRARWPLDRHRLERAVARGERFALVVGNWLGGGTQKAISDLEERVGYGGATPLRLTNRQDGYVELLCESPAMRAVFSPEEVEPLFELLASAGIGLVVVHQLLGYRATLVRRLARYVAERHTVAWIHDFYPVCPRVNLIDAVGRYCGVADELTCARCVTIGGEHEAAQLAELDPAAQRALFADFYAACGRVVVPSLDTALQLRRAVPDLAVQVLPHLHPFEGLPRAPLDASADEVALLGAIGPHKGSAKLLEIATLARLTNPNLRFHVIGYTDIDTPLLKLGNVSISGKYAAKDLPQLIAGTKAKFALFLHGWPETFCYTLTEAVMHGLIPLVPDIGAPADRVRAAGLGFLLPFPVQASSVLERLTAPEVRSASFDVDAASLEQLCGATRRQDIMALWQAKADLAAVKARR